MKNARKLFYFCFVAVALFAGQDAAVAQSQQQVDKINKWFDNQKDAQKKRDAWFDKQKTGPIQTPGQIQKAGSIQKAGTIQIPTGWKAIKTTDLPCEKRFVICGDTLFEFDRSTLTPQAVSTLEVLIPEFKKQKTHPVKIEGHTDAIGTDEYNMQLSTKRAERVKNWLLEKEIFDKDSLAVVGFGKRKPVAPNSNPDGTDNPQGRQLNRRVEIVVNTCVTVEPKKETTTSTADDATKPGTTNGTVAPGTTDGTASPGTTDGSARTGSAN